MRPFSYWQSRPSNSCIGSVTSMPSRHSLCSEAARKLPDTLQPNVHRYPACLDRSEFRHAAACLPRSLHHMVSQPAKPGGLPPRHVLFRFGRQDMQDTDWPDAHGIGYHDAVRGHWHRIWHLCPFLFCCILVPQGFVGFCGGGWSHQPAVWSALGIGRAWVTCSAISSGRSSEPY